MLASIIPANNNRMACQVEAKKPFPYLGAYRLGGASGETDYRIGERRGRYSFWPIATKKGTKEQRRGHRPFRSTTTWTSRTPTYSCCVARTTPSWLPSAPQERAGMASWKPQERTIKPRWRVWRRRGSVGAGRTKGLIPRVPEVRGEPGLARA